MPRPSRCRITGMKWEWLDEDDLKMYQCSVSLGVDPEAPDAVHTFEVFSDPEVEQIGFYEQWVFPEGDSQTSVATWFTWDESQLLRKVLEEAENLVGSIPSVLK